MRSVLEVPILRIMEIKMDDISITEVAEYLEKQAGGLDWKRQANQAILQAIRDGKVAPIKKENGEFAFRRI